ncbi:TPA: hypothetical protein N0F65_001507 [Lagenidium giganteum]|uniref:Uncharacterized protein n=1 Tax=Lagenidium giganteum TaxID=4803 RepID=A0AAV2Z4H1_9STRA|nr:TPA: hypothetical protein N0F65_001507 [Lagenidium giganteum]
MDDGSDALRSSAERRHRPERHRFGVRNRMNQRSRSPSTDGVEMGPHAMSPHDRSALMTPKFASVVDRITTTEPPHQYGRALLMGCDHALSRERRRGGSSPPEFNFGDQNQGPLIEDQPRDSKKYMSSKGSGQGIKPGAAIMGSEEAHLLRERFMPPTESSRFLSNILSKKRKAAANPKLQTDKKKLSLESMSAPRGSPHSSSPVKTTTQQARMTEWRTTRATSASKAADAVSSEKPRPRGRVSLDRSGTLAPAIGAIGDRVARRSSLTPPTRVSPRLKQNSPDWKKPSPSSSKKEIGQGSINFITRRSTRAQNAKKAKNKDGTADMPINLDSDSESEYERVDNSNGINPADEERAAIVEMKDVEVWIGPFECRADVFFNKEAMAICSIR